jgi:serine/threonine protein kinase
MAAKPPAVQLVGPYVLADTLGSGAFGFVKLGVHKETGERVAVKFLKKDKVHLNSSSKQATTEVAALTKLSHKHIIQCKGLDWNAKYTTKDGLALDVIAIVLELASGLCRPPINRDMS